MRQQTVIEQHLYPNMRKERKNNNKTNKVNTISTRCIIISEAVTVPSLMMRTLIVSEESLTRDT